MDKRDLAAVWTVLETNPPKSQIDAVSTGYAVDAGELLAGIDSNGNRYLLIPLLPGEAARVNTRGRALHLDRLLHGGTHYLAIKCLLAELYPVFTQFTRELAATVDGVNSPARAASEAFDRWKALFSDASARAMIGESELIGLLGELLTLETILSFANLPTITFWRGPYQGVQDFRTKTYALEVKTTLAREGRVVSIASIDQLDSSAEVELFLVHHQLEIDPTGFCLQDVFNRVLSKGAPPDELEAALKECGVHEIDLSLYANRRYRHLQSRVYETSDPAFPRITRSSFKQGNVPPGTLRLSYSIDLTNQPPTPHSASEAAALFEEVALEASHAMDT